MKIIIIYRTVKPVHNGHLGTTKTQSLFNGCRYSMVVVIQWLSLFNGCRYSEITPIKLLSFCLPVDKADRYIRWSLLRQGLSL